MHARSIARRHAPVCTLAVGAMLLLATAGCRATVRTGPPPPKKKKVVIVKPAAAHPLAQGKLGR